jgi:hypothetical protein
VTDFKAISLIEFPAVTNNIPIGIADMKFGPAPNLVGRRLGELNATSFKLLEHCLNVGDLDRSELARVEGMRPWGTCL